MGTIALPQFEKLEDAYVTIAGQVSRRRYVARGVPGGYRIWDARARRWWGDHYELRPDDLLTELNGDADYQKITALLSKYRALKR